MSIGNSIPPRSNHQDILRQFTNFPLASGEPEKPEILKVHNKPYPKMSFRGGAHLYMIYSFAFGRYKLGRSDCPEKRLSGIRSETKDATLGLVIVLHNAGYLERYLHGALQQWIIEGEWFAVSREWLDWLGGDCRFSNLPYLPKRLQVALAGLERNNIPRRNRPKRKGRNRFVDNTDALVLS